MSVSPDAMELYEGLDEVLEEESLGGYDTHVMDSTCHSGLSINIPAVCPQCGKKYKRHCAEEEWGYRFNNKCYCTWTCVRKAEKEWREGREVLKEGHLKPYVSTKRLEVYDHAANIEKIRELVAQGYDIVESIWSLYDKQKWLKPRAVLRRISKCKPNVELGDLWELLDKKPIRRSSPQKKKKEDKFVEKVEKLVIEDELSKMPAPELVEAVKNMPEAKEVKTILQVDAGEYQKMVEREKIMKDMIETQRTIILCQSEIEALKDKMRTNEEKVQDCELQLRWFA